jgi:predicted DNA-binding protein with PD1-like motif
VIIAESRQSRRLVGRLDRGADLSTALLEICAGHGVRSGEVRAFGALEQLTLCEYDQQQRVYRSPRQFEAPCELLSLLGNVSEKEQKPFLNARVAVSRERDNGIELIGGNLVTARVFALEFVIDAFDDVLLRRGVDGKTGLHLWNEVIGLDFATGGERTTGEYDVMPSFEQGGIPSSEIASATSWEDVKRAVTPPPLEDHEAPIEVGEFIEHPKFGRCKVEKIEGDHEFVAARLQSGRLIRLSLEVLTLIPAGVENDRRIFRALLGRSG